MAIESHQSPLPLPGCRLFRVQPIEQPAGACLAIAREAWSAVGGMDTQFTPVWFEDVDFCKRLLDSGRKIDYCPSARFHHSGAHSVGKLSFAEKQLFWYTNMLRYARKHFSRAKVLILRMGIIKGMLLRSLAALLGSGPKRGKQPRRTIRLSECDQAGVWTLKPTAQLTGRYGFALLCISTVLHVLSAAWQIFSSGHSAHFGLRAIHNARP